MSPGRSWMARAVALAAVAVVGVAVMTALDVVGEPAASAGSGGATVCAAGHGGELETAPADFFKSPELGQQEDRAEPLAICRLRPECSVDSDCDLRCGVGLGKCVHSNCPIRICRCS